MDGRHPGDRSIDPGGLLRSALEKIVFFECRVAQLEAELTAARQVAERARGDAAEARTRETEALQALAAEREARAAASRGETEAADRVRLLEAERERLMGGLVERARLDGAAGSDGAPGPEEGGADLASFIAELRAEIESLRAATQPASHAAPTPRPAAGTAATLEAMAGAFGADGRTGLGAGDPERLKAFLVSRADKVLYERAMGDLGAAPPEGRLRAIRQLEALGSRAAAPLLAAALGREPEAAVKVALLQALARFGEPFAAGLATGQLTDGRAEVRAAALETLAAVAEHEALPQLTRALGDRSPIVRRRAAVLLNAAPGERAEEALVAALRDVDRGVARAAAVALSGRSSDAARRALARFEVTSRLAEAARAEQAQLAAAPLAPSRAAARIAAALPATAARPATPGPAAPPAPARSSAASGVAVAGTPAAAPLRQPRTAVAVLEAPAAAPATPDASGPPGDALEATLELELRGALRGRTAAELVAATGAPAARVEAALEALRVRGTLAQRGPRWCVA